MFLYYLEKHEHEPRKLCLFSRAVGYIVSRKRHCFGLLYLGHASTNFNNFSFVDNKIVLLSTVCKCYFLPSHFILEIRYAA